MQTAFLFLRFELLRGRIDRDTYRDRAARLVEVVRADPRCEGALTGADLERLTLGEG